jgi:biopolymer transport protein ExbD
MTPYRIKRHRKRKHGGVEGGGGNMHMTLVPFIDMLMILTVFLLVHNSDVDVLPNTKAIAIPQSLSDKKPRPSVVVMITKEDLLVDGRAIAKVADIINGKDAVIQPLKLALMSQADTVLADAAKQDIADREVTILGDRDTPYSVLRKIMATCTDAEYGKVSLAVVEREGAGAKVGPNASARTAAFTGTVGS